MEVEAVALFLVIELTIGSREIPLATLSKQFVHRIRLCAWYMGGARSLVFMAAIGRLPRRFPLVGVNTILEHFDIY